MVGFFNGRQTHDIVALLLSKALPDQRVDLFAGTLALEGVRLIMSRAAHERRSLCRRGPTCCYCYPLQAGISTL